MAAAAAADGLRSFSFISDEDLAAAAAATAGGDDCQGSGRDLCCLDERVT